MIDRKPPIRVVNLTGSSNNTFENIIAVKGTIKIKELALTAPILDDAKKYIVLAKDITTMDSDKIFIQKFLS